MSDVVGHQIRSLYVHIPFCEHKCAYCDFASVAGLRDQHVYVEALRAELRAMARAIPGVVLDTVFLGGGTPGLIEPALLQAVLDEVRGGFRLAAGAEVTIEANPSSTSAHRAARWREAGCTRVSIGLQSLHAGTLRFLERVHDAGRALAAVAEVRAAGFDRVNCDLIYGVPGLDDAAWRASLAAVLDLDPGHLSCYELTVEDGTPLAERVRRGRVVPIDADAALRQHWLAVDMAARAGYRQYEVSAMCRPGHECRHNLAYWRNAFYLAAGVGAHGHLPPTAAAALGIRPAAAGECAAVRYWHVRGVRRYLAAAGSSAANVEGAEALTAADHEAERLMLGLRLNRGVALPGAARQAEAGALAAQGMVAWDGSRVRATRRGQEVLNGVALRLVAAGPAAVRVR